MTTPRYPLPLPMTGDLEEIRLLVDRMNRSLMDIYSKFPNNKSLTQIFTPATTTITQVNNLQTQISGTQPLLGYTPENVANKGINNGYAPLNGSSIVPDANLPHYCPLNTSNFVADSNLLEIYGHMYIYDLGVGATVVQIPLTDTFYQVSAGISGVIEQGFIVQSSQQLLASTSGNYKVDWSMSIDAGVGNQEIEGAIMVGTSAIPWTASHGQVVTAGKPVSVAGTGLIRLQPNDLLRVCVLNHTGTNAITIDHMSCSVHRVGA